MGQYQVLNASFFLSLFSSFENCPINQNKVVGCNNDCLITLKIKCFEETRKVDGRVEGTNGREVSGLKPRVMIFKQLRSLHIIQR